MRAKIWLSLLLTLLIAGCVPSTSLTEVDGFMPAQEGYSSVEEALMSAMREALPLSEKWEYGGILYQHDGKFYYSPPATSESNTDIKIKARYPKGAKLVALYHTHPKGKKSGLFSHNDISTSEQLKLPYYMGNVGDNSVRVFIPGESQVETTRDRVMGRSKYSEGTLITEQLEQLEQDRLKLAQVRAMAAQATEGS